MAADRCPYCGGVVEGVRRGPAWLARAREVHELSCPSLTRVRRG